MLLLGLLLYSSWHWIVKTTANLVVLVFFWVTYTAWPGIQGWPTDHALPDHFYLHAIQVAEPEHIFVWGTELEHGMGQTTPRAYRLPYSPALHDKVDKAARKLKKGLPVIGQIANRPTLNTEIGSLQQTQDVDQDVVFVDAPQSLIPGKN